MSKGAKVRESACEEEYGKEPVPEFGTACAEDSAGESESDEFIG